MAKREANIGNERACTNSEVTSSPICEKQRAHFVTLGMVVLDELHFPNQEPIKDIIGGSGAYCRSEVHQDPVFQC